MRRHTVASLVAAAVVAAMVPPATSSQAAERPLRYVALGDSYSAASGVLPPDPAAPPSCMRSARNYPHVIAARTSARLTDVTCGAAQTKDFFTAQHPDVAPQLDAVRKGTQLVTMTIGGNDNDTFISAIAKCGTAGVATLGQGSPCEERYGSSFADDIRTKTYRPW